MEKLKTMDVNNPQYLKAGQEQRKLKDNSKVIEDFICPEQTERSD